MMNLSPQSQQLYQILLGTHGAFSAKELAARLHIFPNTVYRLAEPLVDMGLITKTDQYPAQYCAKSVDEGLSLFLLHQNDWFSQQFTQRMLKKDVIKSRKIPASQQIELSFVQSRDELMRLSVGETERATRSIDLLRSGGEIPADLLLAMVEAKKRGVVTRMLIQDYSSENANQVDSWKKNGILVRKTFFRYVRLMLYDVKVIYFMSYRHADSERDMGMKISYPPFAAILSQLFNEWWKKAEKI